jgi:hypothetical protein
MEEKEKEREGGIINKNDNQFFYYITSSYLVWAPVCCPLFDF